MATEADLSTRGFVILIFGVAVLLCCGVPTSGFYLYLKDTRDEPAIRAAGEAYLSAVVRRDPGGTYDLLCAADRRRESRAAWVGRAPDPSGPTGFRITDVTIKRPSETPTLRSVTAKLTYPDRASRTVHLSVERQDGDWKVCSPEVR
ncbi:hypothetical protein [Micromonospora sp. WMMD714]|uniref:Rv0361 family membrane protein n=1 Tax=Micromonospora sp. WMMD714 TaxID=3016097 RepID=UPI00249B8752|nr:hypothetical protein [Micromonospora sp. WMMD714]WFE64789.1 hypothetical protein O7625_16620 [Micromonospora sp. WMMD714]